MTEQVIQCPQACTVTVQLEITNPLFQIDSAGGAQIGLAIALVWAVGFAFRQVAQAIKVGDSTKED